ncbi:LytTR family DNA-binding domain-containing protein [Allomuricauda taeanensis]|uniref:LytR/AlgR family response regulator transcription factor n=1 Tax=Flagellimonas taeanensis TaxID=1005926 RepID=UPI002E7B207E|nr:LytTR family DNA-binding domain-containing protein [Allomuricauda taeanensis]MEE1964564.1 LytTR family DNA-binding domain-containing protein [Allomuricauda taeanensis]
MANNFPYVAVVDIVSDLDDIKDVLVEKSFDLIIVDTDITRGNVFEYLEAYMDVIIHHELIVVSSTVDFAIDCFKFSALDYILKPIRHSEMEVAIERAKANIGSRRLDTQTNYLPPKAPIKIIAIPSVTEVKILPVDTIVYLEAEGKYTTFHLTNGTSIVSSRNLGIYEELLANNNFFRIHHSYIVNVDLACNVFKKDGTYLEIFNKKYLPISKRKAESFYRFLGI